jgi:beta-lactamase superfamily II metal-dependent hydrolase
VIPLHNGLLQIFDVQHGACALLTMPAPGGGGRRLMIDCGHSAKTGWRPGDHLRDIGVTFLDRLVVTNLDEDHVSGFPNLLKRGIGFGWMTTNPTVSPWLVRFLKTEDGMGAGIEALSAHLAAGAQPFNTSIQPLVPNATMQWFWNPYPTFEDENNLSCVVRLSVCGYNFLFPGDMERDGFENLINTCPAFRECLPNIDVLIASHHGRENGTYAPMFDVWGCHPKLVVISDDYKKHATQETNGFYNARTSGIRHFRGDADVRYVLTTRNEGELCFSFQNAQCIVH